MKFIKTTFDAKEPEDGHYWFKTAATDRPTVERVYRTPDGSAAISGWSTWRLAASFFTHWCPDPIPVPSFTDEHEGETE